MVIIRKHHPNQNKIMFRLEKVCDKIYRMHFDTCYDLCMTWWRCSEYMECANDRFRKKSFTLVEYMEWYSKTHGKDAFTYPADFAGYNIPSRVIHAVYIMGDVEDINKYDNLVVGIYKYLKSANPENNFFIMGTSDDQDSFDHELCHALFDVDEEYRQNCLDLLEDIPQKDRDKFCKVLEEKIYYHPDVHPDEMQAYLSDDLPDELPKSFEKYRKPFIDNFQIFKKKYLGK